MEAKDKANEIINKFVEYTPTDEEFEVPNAKKCALILVRHILDVIDNKPDAKEWKGMDEYWQEVRWEIERSDEHNLD